MKEIWKDVPGYEGVFKVSNTGFVKSLERVATQKSRHGGTQSYIVKPKMLSQLTTPQGYKRVQLAHAGIKTKVPVHVLVARAFLPNCEKKPCVNHINGIKTDNRVENLEWVTHRENSLHGQRGKSNTGVVGIYFHPTRKRYQGMIYKDGKRHCIGDHKDLESAKTAYTKKMEELGLFDTRYALLDC